MRLIDEIERQHGASARLKNARTLVHQVQGIVASVTFLRNHLFAHRNASIRYEVAFKKAAVKPNDIRRLIDTSLKVANKALVELNEPEQIPNQYVIAHTKKLLDRLSGIEGE